MLRLPYMKNWPNYLIITVIAFFFLLSNCIGTKANPATHKQNIISGQLIDSVKCNKHPNFSYALYLPTRFDNQFKWPVIYIFDPAARGKSGVQCLMQAAEKYGYILACSNNSRNGEMTLSIEAANNMFEDVEAKFNLDFRRIYTSGFSGGSRVASYIALNSDKIAGVIGCGAGFPSTDLSLKNLRSFDYVGIVGFKDMNYLEMLTLEERITKIGTNAVILTFDGGHRKPDADMVEIALGWIQLKTIKKGILPQNDTFENALFKKWNNCLLELETQKDWVSAAKYYNYLIEYFPKISKSLLYKEKLDSLLNSRPYKKAVKEWENAKNMEESTITLLMNSSYIIIQNESLPDSILSSWNTSIGNLRSQTSIKNLQLQRMAARVLNMLSISGYMQVTTLMEEKKYAKAIIAIQLNLAIEPENYNIYYQLACAYASNNEVKKSIKSLEKALNLGFKNKKAIENETAFLSIRNDKRFKALVAKLQ